MSSNIDDDFDWAAAVAEIDKACSRHVALDNGGAEPSGTQSRALHQKTLDSFVRGDALGQRPNTLTKDQVQYGTREALDSSRQWSANQLPSSGTDFRIRHASSGQVSSDGAEASQSKCHLPLDCDAAKVWIYPANVPRRSYQFNITKSALFSNTLVCLPTGLGKTLIAAVVMYNYFRWFPTGKIVFTAPSRPLVVQQIEACHKVTGIPQEMTIDMTGQMNPQIRAANWQSKRVFFVTPQVLEKDMRAGRAATKQIICLVVDEAHRATGNYSYCVVVRELLAARVEPRILALTATPGSKQITIQAVVDNLQISSLEYRDENDPDVRQYTHSRKIELVEVPMNAESTQVNDVFIEVLQPIVQRLCYLGAFYGRDIAKLTPYEFLTARDKFRQAPPPSLQQSKYQEVESYFGLAITLFHIFKLLVTHGMRPAYEMLRQKMEQGVLKRLAKNQKLLQVQDMMKQSIGHGAPSPKLEKVVDVINDHFRLHDATNTRVIIFTNFRESVKDIMDKLAASCATVKAMEFIGQSSGKTSKGQTQKTQQAVLQRFRGGCYNTIVATSIAEEGLDIMEVDLVICFDSNISPLRMIQRMGRTGRKRDGRVVVLASGGSEIQGYLKKQSKSKALGKHMVNGGLQSFNFHASHHMIPHSLRTSVEFVELSIKDFVPRGRKLKDKDPTAGVPRKLTEKEQELMKLVRALPDKNPPEGYVHKFFASPIYQVKHSKRSCLLMDCLQTLGIRLHLTNEVGLSRDEVISQSPIELPLNEIQLPISPPCETLSDDSGYDVDPLKPESSKSRHVFPSSPVAPSVDQCIFVKPDPVHLTSPEKVLDKQGHHEGVGAKNNVTSNILDGFEVTNKSVTYSDRDGERDGNLDHLKNAHLTTTTTNQGLPADLISPGDRKAKVVSQAAHLVPSFPASDEPDLDYDESPDKLKKQSFHRCRYSAGVVSVTQSGLVIIASPPSLSLPKKIRTKGLPNLAEQSDRVRVNSKTLQHSEMQANNLNEQRRAGGFSPHPATLGNQSCYDVTPICHLAKSLRYVEYVEATPDEKAMESSSKDVILLKDAFQARALRFEELSPRLAEFANQGVVPSTPGKERTPVSGKVPVSSIIGTDSMARFPDLPSNGETVVLAIRSNSNSLPTNLKPLLPSSLPVDRDTLAEGRPSNGLNGLTPDAGYVYPIEDVSPQPRILTKVRPLIFDHLRSERLPVPEVNSSGVPPDLEEAEEVAGNHPKAKAKSPLQIRSSKSSGEDWKTVEGEASGSVQKPRQLKRLRRAREKLPPVPSIEGSLLRNHNRSVEVRNKVNISRSERVERHQKRLAARQYFDEEAGVSSDDDDESLSGEDEYEAEDSSLEGFIDTGATQHLNGSVDMINVYRKSLLTPSPLGYPGPRPMNSQQRYATPSSDATPSSVELSSANRGLDDASDFSTAPSIKRSSFVSPQNSFQTKAAMGPETCNAMGQGEMKEAIPANTTLRADIAGPEDQGCKRPELRKRKLSFQSSPSYDDDLFEGVDLDALEAQATEMSRMRSQAHVISGSPPHERFVAASTGSLPSRPHKDNEFQFIPSFDLGLGD